MNCPTCSNRRSIRTIRNGMVLDSPCPDCTPGQDGCWSSPQVVALTGATYRQLDYWCRQGLIDLPGQGAGTHRRWSAAHVARAVAVKRAADLHGQSLAQLLVSAS